MVSGQTSKAIGRVSHSTVVSIALHAVCLTLGLALLRGRHEPSASDRTWVSLESVGPSPGVLAPAPPLGKRARKKVQKTPAESTALHANPAANPLSSSEEGPSDGKSDITGDRSGDTAGAPAPRDYFDRLLAEISRHKRYPRLARVRGWEGRVVVEFTVGADGRVERVIVQHGSPHEVLNEAALDLIRSRERFEAPPAGSITPFTLRVPVVYSLRGV